MASKTELNYIGELTANLNRLSLREENDIVDLIPCSVNRDDWHSISASPKVLNNEELVVLNPYENLDRFVCEFATKISNLSLTQKAMNEIFLYVRNLVECVHKFDCSMISNHQHDDPIEVLDLSNKTILNKLRSFDSNYKREKIIQNSNVYVKPNEMCIGTNWKLAKDKTTKRALPVNVRSTCQVVSILDTLGSIFSDSETLQLYCDYNSENSTKAKHKCISNEYKDFCCGKVFKQNKLFTDFPNSLQIQFLLMVSKHAME